MDPQNHDIARSIEHTQGVIADLELQLEESKESLDETFNELYLAAKQLNRDYGFLTYKPPFQNMMHLMDQADNLMVGLIRQLKESMSTIQQHLEDIKAPLNCK